jgi:uncharacterized membrane protein YhaH (DUF805 family)
MRPFCCSSKVKQCTLVKEVHAMNRVLSIVIGLTTFWPTLALAEGAGGTYRGIGSIYYTIIGAILIYGVNDAFGKKAMNVAAPIIVIGLYLLLPPG